MSTEAKTKIAEGLAALSQVVDFPSSPFGFGSDISGAADLDPTLAEVDAFSTLALAQAIVRRLDCPRGALPDDKDYGIDLRSYINRGVTAADLRQLGGQIRNEVAEDDRVDTVTVRIAPNSTGSSLLIELAIRPLDPNLGGNTATGGFTLTLNASDSALVLEDIKAAL